MIIFCFISVSVCLMFATSLVKRRLPLFPPALPLRRWWSRNIHNDSGSLPLSNKYLPQFDSMMKQRFFYAPTGHLYNSPAGLYDLGPHSTTVKWKLLENWKKEFIEEEENIFPLETSTISPEDVLEASGHVKKFKDIIIKDSITLDYLRLDHVVEEHLAKQSNPSCTWNDAQKILYSFDIPAIKNLLQEIGITKNPETGNPLSDPLEFNLMFQTKLGVEGKRSAYLRPELAQGIFTNFGNLLRQSDGSLPFGGASIGNVFRNETSARQGLLRTREFTLAEMEFFFHPKQTDHPNFSTLPQDERFPILPSNFQMEGKDPVMMNMAEMKENLYLTNEIHLYYIHKAANFLCCSGIEKKRIRIRQHLSDEMAHYASDCWDIEIYTIQYGWIECVGIANRSHYDLSQHIERSPRGNQLVVFVPFEDGQSFKEKVLTVKPVQPVFGKTFKKNASLIIGALQKMTDAQLRMLRVNISTATCAIELGDENFQLQGDMVNFVESEVTVAGEQVIPHVIEPSFGINRILYCIFEHCYRVREIDSARGFMALPTSLCPIQCEVLVMKRSENTSNITDHIVAILRKQGIPCKKSVQAKSRSIGKSYSVIDEVGTPFAITIDDQTEKECSESTWEYATVTVRERNSMEQTRLPLSKLSQFMKETK